MRKTAHRFSDLNGRPNVKANLSLEGASLDPKLPDASIQPIAKKFGKLRFVVWHESITTCVMDMNPLILVEYLCSWTIFVAPFCFTIAIIHGIVYRFVLIFKKF